MQTQQSSEMRSSSSIQTLPDYLLSRRQLAILVALGIFFWFVFAMAVRFTSGLGLFGGVVGVATFLLSIAVGWLIVILLRRLASLTAGQLVTGVALSTAAAALCDGIVLTWMPTLYGNDPADVLLGAAYILWGVGVLIIIAYILAVRERGK